MKSTEVYSILRQEIGPWAKERGFKRGKSFLSWSRPCEVGFLVFWAQISQDGWDQYAGSKFTVEFQRSKEADVGAVSLRRARIGALLNDQAREEIRNIQNRVIASLPRPPKDYFVLQTAESTRDWYLRKFEPVIHEYSKSDDIWFRYHTAEHVSAWGRLLMAVLPACIEEAAEWSW